ncbi:MAG: hypothetical protein IPI11_12860 [Haliscomenobacter sp.]|nr:hypothetical protein [Haliscomenobacter sp.]
MPIKIRLGNQAPSQVGKLLPRAKVGSEFGEEDISGAQADSNSQVEPILP